jgi:hypothetical protein
VFSLLLLPTIFYDSIEIYVMDYSADKTTIVVMFFFQKTKLKRELLLIQAVLMAPLYNKDSNLAP